MKLDDAILKAKSVANYSNMKFKLGAILFDNKNFVIGFNRAYNVKCVNKTNNFSIHAEEMAIIKANRIAGFDFENSTLVIVRINNSGEFMKSFPCSNCQRLINQFNISTIYFIA